MVGFGIFVLSTTLTIENCTLNVKGAQYGINGLGGKDDKLVIRNATVSAEGKKNGSVRDIAELTLIGCKISEPEGAEFDSMLHAIILNDKILKRESYYCERPYNGRYAECRKGVSLKSLYAQWYMRAG